MNIIIDKIDQDSFGIIADMLSDDLNFLLFLKEHNIKPKNKEINWDNIDWKEVSNCPDLSLDFMHDFQHYLNWYDLTRMNKDSMDFIRAFPDLVEWSIICSGMSFNNISYDYDFFEEFHDNFNWQKLSRWDYIAEDFIDRFANSLDWDIISGTQGLSRYLVEKYRDRIVWSRVRHNRSFSNDLIEEFEPVVSDDEDIDLQLDDEEEPLVGPRNAEEIEENIINNIFNNNLGNGNALNDIEQDEDIDLPDDDSDNDEEIHIVIQ